MPLKGLKKAEWVDAGRSCALWLTDARGALHRFDGLRAADFERVAGHLAATPECAARLVKAALSAKGRNFGSARVVGGRLELLDDEGALIAPLPLSAVGMAPKPLKNELELQMLDDDTLEKDVRVPVRELARISACPADPARAGRRAGRVRVRVYARAACSPPRGLPNPARHLLTLPHPQPHLRRTRCLSRCASSYRRAATSATAVAAAGAGLAPARAPARAKRGGECLWGLPGDKKTAPFGETITFGSMGIDPIT